MAGSGDGPQTPHRLEPIPLQTRGLSGRAALGLVVAVVLLLVGVGLAGQTGDRGPRPEAALVRPTVSPVATPSPTAPPAPPIGTPPPRVAISFGPVATCPPGSTPDEPGSADQARPPPDVPTAMAFNRRAGRLVALAEAADGVETWTFDVCTNTWMQMHPDREPPNAGELVYDANSDVTVGLIGSAEWPSAIWAYDLGTDTWTEKRGLAPTGARLRFYDPVSGLVVVTADDGDPDTPGPELWSYEVETDAWSSIRQANQLGSEPVALAYDTSVDRMVAYAVRDQSGEARTWLFDPRTGTWSGTRAETPELFVGGWFPQPAIAFDEEAGRTVVAGLLRAVAYDATVDRWETLLDPAVDVVSGACSTPECRSGHQMVYDAVNGRLAAYGGEVYTMCTWEAVDDMWALDMATRSWTLVLPPAPEPPPLRDLASEPPDSMGPDRSPWVRAAKATLHGGPFFTRVPGVADEPWSGTPPTEAASVADGLLVPECQGWTEGTVWWEETTSDPSSRAWVEIDLGGTFVLDAAVVQADVNDTYRLSYRDRQTSEWVPLWDVPFGEAGGMATRPEQGDASVRWPLPRPVVTDALRFEATAGDYQYSVSEIAVFGLPTP